ncbi:hypothetical protein I6A84_44115 [Frankia sp. CNm7]|uniref:Uncharacterized protein n=1 Tax=Frankia nepalensis TaxID=1836974 RepID=A0A937RQR5_9ACTN|nr:hypothetical protein [Frankia nepalensis]MBL7510453.1 hypothetical protein [Frankia nepalensis]MBL7524845.1 hypothetical protein [Frankia nepalensis]MBL7630953.1 hypothetical protein [Frankia nepalensis]
MTAGECVIPRGHVTMKPYPKTEAGRRSILAPPLLVAQLKRPAKIDRPAG